VSILGDAFPAPAPFSGDFLSAELARFGGEAHPVERSRHGSISAKLGCY
jgi:hypothetical protein